MLYEIGWGKQWERVLKMTARGWGEREVKKHKGFCGVGDCWSCRAALAVEYAGLKQPKGFWVNREKEHSRDWPGFLLVCSMGYLTLL